MKFLRNHLIYGVEYHQEVEWSSIKEEDRKAFDFLKNAIIAIYFLFTCSIFFPFKFFYIFQNVSH